MRNQLLNFRPRARSIHIVDEVSTEIYDILVLNQKKMFFDPKEENIEDLSSEKELDISEDENILWELPSPGSVLEDKYTDLNLQTNLKAQDLQKRLFYIHKEAESVLQEQGYNVLYLVLGFLEWRESSNEKPKRAPLLLMPVKLVRKNVKGSFTLEWNEEDVLTNISLQAKLSDQSIVLPDFEMPEDKSGVYSYFKEVEKIISKMEGWSVVNNIYLSFFNFTKFVMYNDLDLRNWPDLNFNDNPILNSIFGAGDNLDLIEFSEDDVDAKLKVNELYHVVDADSSQIAVIEEGKAGKNLVVEGPPGTGKSQTIVNLIAELLVAGKTVLFVSEKMAALEVVKERLDRVGLGEFCIELHSRKANKKEVLKELERTIYTAYEPLSSLEEKYGELEKLRSELNEYNKIIHKKFGKIEFSPFYLFGIKEEALVHFKKSEKEMPRTRFENVEEITYVEWQNAISSLNDIGEILKSVQPISENSWRFCSPELILPMDQEEIKDLLVDSINILENIISNINHLVEITGITPPQTKADFDSYLPIFEVLKSSKPIDRNIIHNSKWDIENKFIFNLIDNIKEYNNYESTLLTRFKDNILDKDILSSLDEFKDGSSKFLKSFRGGYKKARNDILSFYNAKSPEKDELIIQDLENLIKCQNIRSKIRNVTNQGRELFGIYWNDEKSNGNELKELADWILSIKELLNSRKITDKALDSNGVKKEEIENSIQAISKDYAELIEKIKELNHFLKMDCNSIFKNHLSNLNFTNINSQMNDFLKELPRLQQWSQFILIRKEKPNSFVDPIINLVNEDKLDPDDIIPCFKGNFADSFLKIIFLENPILSGFIGDKHDNTVKQFIDLDEKLILLNRARIVDNLSQKRPKVQGNISRNSELGILLSEFNRKRGHLPIRKLFWKSGKLIQDIKPCFMMSPLSIAQFIDPKITKDIHFDVVIFDEASQVKPEDALGALMRGKQVIVMGDTKQLPPTSFFDSMVDSIDDEDDYELASLADMESLLHLCKKSFDTKMLRWHYRSRHESLIAVSNQEFYDNNLLIYPSPCHESDKIGLKFEYRPNTVYDRGKSSANRLEAKEVVKAAMDHYKKYGDKKSLGIGTFNVRQQQVILEEVELLLRQNPGMEEYFSSSRDESFFVKNLETIQGDERDVILISVGYGFDVNHKLNQNFGPLNKDGGERRLNVLITRAREKCVVFSNFKSSDIRVESTSSFGLRALKTFLEYAETKNLVSITPPGEDTDSPFEDSVYEFLRDYGYEVQKQVGCAGFRIDLAVVDPKSPGRYLLGIECDGAMYHSSPVARDRDRLRQQVLEGLGWNIYHIWSTEWYRNRSESQRKLLEDIKKAETFGRIKDKNEKKEMPKTILKPKKIENIEEKKDNSVNNLGNISNYEVCHSIRCYTGKSMDKTPSIHLAEAIDEIVKIEGPIHLEELAKRLRTLWGLKRTTNKVRDTTHSAVYAAQRQLGTVFIKNDFVYYKNKPIVPRQRTGDTPAKIDLICDEEIEEALKMVIGNQYATAPEELVKQAGYIFGIKVIRGATADRINGVLETLIQRGELQKAQNGMVNILEN
jgi:superfamily I DNA and/or RNA helicase/very-short-patch-repair endonuclease